MVVEFPRKLYFPYVRSREATAFVLKKKKKIVPLKMASPSSDRKCVSRRVGNAG